MASSITSKTSVPPTAMELDVAAVTAVADAVAAAATAAGSGGSNDNHHIMLGPPPPPLPPGWLLKQSTHNPSYYYYYDMTTGYSTWDPPTTTFMTGTTGMTTAEEVQDVLAALPVSTKLGLQQDQDDDGSGLAAEKVFKSDDAAHFKTENGGDAGKIKKEDVDSGSTEDGHDSKRRKTKEAPKQVRVLHILKKHKDSRRPSSWRQPKITQTREEAHEELQGLLELLEDDSNDLEALRATFEELARTESDCSSAKRGGDLGYFTRGKMQPPFEEASFNLKKGGLTKEIVDSSSGSHIILRIG